MCAQNSPMIKISYHELILLNIYAMKINTYKIYAKNSIQNCYKCVSMPYND